jgi:peptide/nickel transport system permease protein
MIRHLLKKGLLLLLSFWCVVTGTFFLMHAIPGDPFIGERVIPQEVLDSLHAYFGLDQPLWVQYINYLQGLCRGELGPSVVYPGRSVNQFIAEGFPISAQLGLQALLLAIPTGIFLGTWAALKRGQ